MKLGKSKWAASDSLIIVEVKSLEEEYFQIGKLITNRLRDLKRKNDVLFIPNVNGVYMINFSFGHSGELLYLKFSEGFPLEYKRKLNEVLLANNWPSLNGKNVFIQVFLLFGRIKNFEGTGYKKDYENCTQFMDENSIRGMDIFLDPIYLINFP